MFAELNNILNINPNRLPELPLCVLMTQTGGADGGFVLHHFISTFIRGGGRVCLVGLHQTLSHYNNVAKKLGVNLNEAKEKGQFVFVDIMRQLRDSILNAPCELSNQKEESNENILPQDSSLKSIYLSIKGSIATVVQNSSQPVLLLIDNISVLLNLGMSGHAIGILVQSLRHMMHGCGGRLLVGAEMDAEDEEAERLCLQLHHGCNLVLEVAALPSGYSKDVHGEVRHCVGYAQDCTWYLLGISSGDITFLY